MSQVAQMETEVPVRGDEKDVNGLHGVTVAPIDDEILLTTLKHERDHEVGMEYYLEGSDGFQYTPADEKKVYVGAMLLLWRPTHAPGSARSIIGSCRASASPRACPSWTRAVSTTGTCSA